MPFGEPKDIDVSVDKTILTQSAHDLAFISIKIIDDNGNWNKNSDNEIKIRVSGNLELVGVDNGNIRSHHYYKTNTINSFKGRCLAVVRAEGAGSGTVQIQVNSLNKIKSIEFEYI